MENVTVDWSTARVREGKLTVELEGRPPSGWKATARRVAHVLDSGQLGKLKVGKRKLRVFHVACGSEEKLRHFLESVVTEANAAHLSVEPRGDETARGPDADMTQRFRSFADRVAEDDPSRR
jgi:hypothetical protein